MYSIGDRVRRAPQGDPVDGDLGILSRLQLAQNRIDAEDGIATFDHAIGVDQGLREGVGDGDLLAIHVEDGMSHHVDENPLVVTGERAVAGVLDAVRRLYSEEPFALDGHIEHAAGASQRSLIEVGPNTLDTVDAPIRIVAGETLLGLLHFAQKHGVAFEAGNLGIGQVVGDRLMATGLGQHARRGDVYAFDHSRSRGLVR